MEKIKSLTKNIKLKSIISPIMAIIFLIIIIITGTIIINKNKSNSQLTTGNVEKAVNNFLFINKNWYGKNITVKNVGVHFKININSVKHNANNWSIKLSTINNNNISISHFNYQNVNLILDWKYKIIDSEINNQIEKSGYTKINKHPFKNSGQFIISGLSSNVWTNKKYVFFNIDLTKIKIPDVPLYLSDVNTISLGSNSIFKLSEYFSDGEQLDANTIGFSGELPLNIIMKNLNNPGDQNANFILPFNLDLKTEKLVLDLTTMQDQHLRPLILGEKLVINWINN